MKRLLKAVSLRVCATDWFTMAVHVSVAHPVISPSERKLEKAFYLVSMMKCKKVNF